MKLDKFPWDDWLKLALGKMGMSSNNFWDLSLDEFYSAVEGFSEFHGGKPPPLSRDELQDLMELYPD